MSIEKTLCTEIRSLVLEAIENIPLQGDEINETAWTKKVAKIFEVLGCHEVLKRRDVYESLKACIAKNASVSYVQHVQENCCPSETASPHALAFAILELGYDVRLTFFEQCPEKLFFRQYFKPHLVKVLFEQLFPQDVPPSFLFM